jgi:hypothetical protein
MKKQNKENDNFEKALKEQQAEIKKLKKRDKLQNWINLFWLWGK